MNIYNFRDMIVVPTLTKLGMFSPQAVNLMLGTASVESGFEYFKQINGPALGWYQIEPATHFDIMLYLNNKPKIRIVVNSLAAEYPTRLEQLSSNLAYATAIARIKYWRSPAPIPDTDNGLGRYWKSIYNAAGSRGLPASGFNSAYAKHVLSKGAQL